MPSSSGAQARRQRERRADRGVDVQPRAARARRGRRWRRAGRSRRGRSCRPSRRSRSARGRRGRAPRAWRRARPTSIAPRASVATPTTASAPSPSTAAARRTLSCAAAEVTIRQRALCARQPGAGAVTAPRAQARSRASSRPSRFDAVPPLVSTPEPAAGGPSVAASQRTRRSSTSVAAGDCSKESSDWFVAPIASSAAAARSSVGQLQVRGAARVGDVDAVGEHVVAQLREHVAEREALLGAQDRSPRSCGASAAGSAPENGPLAAATRRDRRRRPRRALRAQPRRGRQLAAAARRRERRGPPRRPRRPPRSSPRRASQPRSTRSTRPRRTPSRCGRSARPR